MELHNEADDLEGTGEEWRSPIWELTRMVKGYFKEGTTADDAFKQVDAIVTRSPGKWDLFDIDQEDAYTSMVSFWTTIRMRPGETPLDTALAMALAHPLKSERSQKRRHVPKYDRFVSLAGWLQIVAGNRPIMLPVHLVKRLLNTSVDMVSTWRRWAKEDGYLVEVAPHVYRSAGGSKATEFRVPEQWVRVLRELREKRMA